MDGRRFTFGFDRGDLCGEAGFGEAGEAEEGEGGHQQDRQGEGGFRVGDDPADEAAAVGLVWLIGHVHSRWMLSLRSRLRGG
ncbi:MAG: hypothetical protein HZA51_10245 [Planctomycetes bacterium]|nr:hypothetical protein [Planctomycetota bacterium]